MLILSYAKELWGAAAFSFFDGLGIWRVEALSKE
jgi:hypothetical protein